MISKSEALKLVTSQRKKSQSGLGAQYENTRKCIEFYNGDTMSYEDRIQFTDGAGRKKRALVQFNDVQAPVDSVVGFMAQNRRKARFIARTEATEDQQIFSKYMNELHEYVRSNANADQIETDQDADMMINGYGAIETDISYVAGNATRDPNGEIIKVRLDPMNVGWDASAKARNILDKRWVYYFDDFDLKDALDLFDKSKPEDFAQAENEDSDGGYQYNPYGGVYDKIKAEDAVEWVSKDDETVRIYNHQFFKFETFYRVKNPLYSVNTPEDALFVQSIMQGIMAEQDFVGPDGMNATDMFVFDPASEILTLNEAQKRRFIEEFGPSIKPLAFKRKCYYTVVYSGKHVFSVFKSISQQGFSVKFKTGVYNAAKKIWIGMVNAMMQPAEYKNKALTELMFTIAANSKGGVIVEEDAVEDITDFERKWAKTDGVIIARPGALAAGKFQEKAKPALNTGLENIIQLSEASLQGNGVDPAFVGNISEAQQSGILYKRRIRQIISKMARYFDSILLYQKEDARMLADLIRVWVQNNNGQFIRITGEDYADRFIQINEDSLAGEYDVDIQEAPQSPEDKEETAGILGQYADKLAATGNAPAATAFYAESLRYLPIDGDVRNRLVKALQPQQDGNQAIIQQLQAQIEALQSEMQRVQMAKIMSEIALNQARAEKEMIGAGKVQAETVRELEEARQTSFENDLLRTTGAQNFNVTI